MSSTPTNLIPSEPVNIAVAISERRLEDSSSFAGLLQRKPRMLDLFCCAGGAATGYSQAGFQVVGVDIKPQPNYPYTFIQGDALCLEDNFIATFDAIHASPPCQSYSDLAKRYH